MNGIIALKQYQQMSAHGAVMDATPHRLIQMLLDGALSRILTAKGYMERKIIAEKGEQISQAMSIIEGLRNSLDFEQGGEIAQNLDSLYEYISNILFKANRDNNPALLDEAGHLISQIKGAWDEIPDDAKS